MKKKRLTSIILIIFLLFISIYTPITVKAGINIDQMGEWELSQLEKLYNYLASQGFCLEAIAGVAGNGDAESGLTEDIGKDTAHMYFGDLYFCSSNGEYALINWYSEKGYEIGDITGELSFWVEGEAGKTHFDAGCAQYCKAGHSLEELKTAGGKTGEDGVKYATELWCVAMENCFGGSDAQEYGIAKSSSTYYQILNDRKKFALQAYEYFKSQGYTGNPSDNIPKTEDGKVDAKEVTTIDEEGNKTVAFHIGDMRFYSETELDSFMKLNELSIDDLFITQATINNLTQGERHSLSGWKDKAFADQITAVKVFRIVITLLGILLTVYAILLYLCFWLDRINNFIEIHFVNILTLGKLEVCDDDLGVSYGQAKKTKEKTITVNHRAIIKICLIILGVGALLISGIIYSLIMGAIQWIAGIFTK